MKIFKRYKTFNSKDIILILSQFLLGLTITSRGFFWLVNQEAVLNDSSFYLKIHQVMPIWLWGLIIFITGLFIMLSALYVPTIDDRNTFYKFTFVGGATSFVFYFLMLSVSMESSINWLTPLNFLILTVWTLSLSIISVVELNARRKRK